jgi:hypothetical protein
MQLNTGALLDYKVTHITLEELMRLSHQPATKLTCAMAMKLAAKKAAAEKIVIIQFKHPDPPRFYEKTEYGCVVTLVNANVIKIPKQLIHVAKGVIGYDFHKIKPNYIETLTSLKNKAQNKN